MLSDVVLPNPAIRHAAVFPPPTPGWTMNRATAAARHRSEGKARIAGPSVFRSIGTRSASRLSLSRGLAVIGPHSISAASA